MEKGRNIIEYWSYPFLKDIVVSEKGKKPKAFSFQPDKGFIPYLDIKALETGDIDRYAEEESSKILDDRSIAIVWDGSRSGLVEKGKSGAIGSTIVKIKPFVLKVDYLFFFLRFNYSYFNTNARGTGIPHIDPKILWNIKVPLPPVDEQFRIVDKIEKFLKIIEQGEEHIKNAQYQLKLYRESILQKAFTGQLSEKWRNEHQPESATHLLHYINEQKQKDHEEAIKIWESKVKKWKAENKVGNKPIKPKNQKQFPNLTNLELLDLPDLPKEWEWTWSGNLFNSVTSGSRGWAQYYSDSGSIFVRITNMNFGSLELDLTPDKIQYVNPPDNVEGQRTKLQAGDFLFSITGYLGMFAISPYLENAYINQHVCLARPSLGYNKKYFGYYAISKTGGHFFLNEKQKGAVKAGLRLDDINRFPVPICSLKEQNIIQQKLDIAFASVNQLEKLIENSLNDCEILRQSILKKAFEGKLVPQEPNDEPTSELLKKIQKEKYEWQESQKEKKKISKPKTRMEALTIEQVLKKAKEPISPKELWETSKHKHDIEEFYLELKKLGDKVVEIKSETESLLRLEDAN
tara:strand:+ start:2405 stop:4126 length:1722 start_codon:yes stop_codon:yes gene_type:complete